MYDETLKLVHTTEDLSLLRSELQALRQGLYRVGPSTAGRRTGARRTQALDFARDQRDDKRDSESLSRLSSGGRSGFEEVLDNNVRAVAAEALKADLTASGKGLKEFLEGLEQVLSRFRPIRLTLAFEPTRDMILRLTTFFKRGAGYRPAPGGARAHLVLELTVDPAILGGLQLTTFEGRFWDLSVAGKLDSVLEESREGILSRLKQDLGS